MALDLGFKAQADGAIRVILMDAHADQPRRGDALNVDVAPDAGVGQPRAPVPAEHAMRLAQVRKANRAVLRAVGAALRVSLLDVAVRRIEFDLDLVFALDGDVLDVHDPRPVHVVGVEHALSVDGDVRDGVQALAGQEQRVGREVGLGQRKRTAVEVVLLHQVKRLQLVGAPEGILHAAGVEQVGVDRAGHRGGQPLRFIRRAHLPCAVQGQDFFHTFLPPYSILSPFEKETPAILGAFSAGLREPTGAEPKVRRADRTEKAPSRHGRSILLQISLDFL